MNHAHKYVRTNTYSIYVRHKYASRESVVDETSALGLPTMHDWPPQGKKYCEQWSHRRNCQSTVACVVGCEREVGAHVKAVKVNNEAADPSPRRPWTFFLLHSSIHATASAWHKLRITRSFGLLNYCIFLGTLVNACQGARSCRRWEASFHSTEGKHFGPDHEGQKRTSCAKDSRRYKLHVLITKTAWFDFAHPVMQLRSPHKSFPMSFRVLGLDN